MNIIRTKAVELTAIPAMAYKLKLAGGGAGVKILRLDQDAAAVVTINKRSGEAVPYGKLDEALFPWDAIEEAMELTNGLPYSARGKLKIAIVEQADADEVTEEADEANESSQEVEKISMVDSQEYKAIVDRYSDEKGKVNYALMNKDFIQFAAKSKPVSAMVDAKALTDEILLFVLKSRAKFIAGADEALDDLHTRALLETLDEIDPRSAFKELKVYINRMLARSK